MHHIDNFLNPGPSVVASALLSGRYSDTTGAIDTTLCRQPIILVSCKVQDCATDTARLISLPSLVRSVVAGVDNLPVRGFLGLYGDAIRDGEQFGQVHSWCLPYYSRLIGI